MILDAEPFLEGLDALRVTVHFAEVLEAASDFLRPSPAVGLSWLDFRRQWEERKIGGEPPMLPPVVGFR